MDLSKTRRIERIQEAIQESVEDGSYICLEDYEDALIGWTTHWNDVGPCLVYSEEKVIDIIMQNDEMNYEEALEYFEYNIKGSYLGRTTPVFVNTELFEYENENFVCKGLDI